MSKAVLTKRLPDKTSKAVLTKRVPDKTSILTKRLLTLKNSLEIKFQFSMLDILFRQSPSWELSILRCHFRGGDQFWTMGLFPPSTICLILPSKSWYCWIIILPLHLVWYLWALLVVEKLRCVNMTDVCKYLSHADWHWHMWGLEAWKMMLNKFEINYRW